MLRVIKEHTDYFERVAEDGNFWIVAHLFRENTLRGRRDVLAFLVEEVELHNPIGGQNVIIIEDDDTSDLTM